MAETKIDGFQRGVDNPNWKGGRTITEHGYVLLRVGSQHHLADVRGYAYEHRIVAERMLNRPSNRGKWCTTWTVTSRTTLLTISLLCLVAVSILCIIAIHCQKDASQEIQTPLYLVLVVVEQSLTDLIAGEGPGASYLGTICTKEATAMGTSKIEWCDSVWNPCTGCSPISEGCLHCWAQRMSKRLAGRFGYPADDPFEVTVHEDRLGEPRRWRKPRRVFVCSMGDLFHEKMPWLWIERVFQTMTEARQHTYLLLTKRAAHMREFVTKCYPGLDRCCPHIWLGVTAENQKRADERIPELLQTPAAGRYVSIEPMLGPVNLDPFLPSIYCPRCGSHNLRGATRPLAPRLSCTCGWYSYASVWARSAALSWCIVGGETGPGARPMHPNWVRTIRDQCQAAGPTPFFFKQWGEWGRRGENGITLDDGPHGLWYDHAPGWSEWYPGSIGTHSEHMVRVGRQRAGRLLDGREWNEYPEARR